ncbi:hypothetical protein Ndes2526B_g09396 [Nannochloris sp. 'desiccata']
MVKGIISGLLNRPGGAYNTHLHCSWTRAAGLSVSAMLILLVASNHRLDGNKSDWELVPLIQPLLNDMNNYLATKSAASKYARCDASSLKLHGSEEPLSATAVNARIGINGSDVSTSIAGKDDGKDSELNQHFIQALVLSAPCGKSKSGCCEHNVFVRPGTTDFNVFHQIFVQQQLKYLYALFEKSPPKYILDAGANAGFSTSLFKLLWPDAIIVSVEPNPKNFETLKKNTAAFENVHPINAGLWGRKAKIGQIGNHGEWGLVFQEVGADDKDGMQAYGVWDLARMHDIPSFDFIKIDIEGAEGQVFAPGADISWIDKASAVSLEIHDFFHGYFNLGETEISSRIAAAFGSRPYGMTTDNEHTIYARYSLLKTLL